MEPKASELSGRALSLRSESPEFKSQFKVNSKCYPNSMVASYPIDKIWTFKSKINIALYYLSEAEFDNYIGQNNKNVRVCS